MGDIERENLGKGDGKGTESIIGGIALTYKDGGGGRRARGGKDRGGEEKRPSQGRQVKNVLS